MTTFEPLPLSSNRWACPCRDAYGSEAELVPMWDSFEGSKRMGDSLVENYRCDQNGDRWQRVVTPSGDASWQYLGRPAASA